MRLRAQEIGKGLFLRKCPLCPWTEEDLRQLEMRGSKINQPVSPGTPLCDYNLGGALGEICELFGAGGYVKEIPTERSQRDLWSLDTGGQKALETLVLEFRS